MIKQIIIYILIGLLVISVGGNVYFIFGKGINIDKRTITTNQNHNEQFQGQISFNMWMSQGNVVKWKVMRYEKIEDVENALNALPPQYSYFTKVFFVQGAGFNTGFVVCVPEFMVEIKK